MRTLRDSTALTALGLRGRCGRAGALWLRLLGAGSCGTTSAASLSSPDASLVCRTPRNGHECVANAEHTQGGLGSKEPRRSMDGVGSAQSHRNISQQQTRAHLGVARVTFGIGRSIALSLRLLCLLGQERSCLLPRSPLRLPAQRQLSTACLGAEVAVRAGLGCEVASLPAITPEVVQGRTSAPLRLAAAPSPLSAPLAPPSGPPAASFAAVAITQGPLRHHHQRSTHRSTQSRCWHPWALRALASSRGGWTC